MTTIIEKDDPPNQPKEKKSKKKAKEKPVGEEKEEFLKK